MPTSPRQFPASKDALRLWQRLREESEPITARFLEAFLTPLIGWLTARNCHVDGHLCIEAAEDTLLSVIRRPDVFRPERMKLDSFLKMAAQRDLLNRLRREAKHQERRIPLDDVALGSNAGKYLGKADYPSLRIQRKEEAGRMNLPDAVLRGLSEGESRALELLLAGERSTGPFAEALGLDDLDNVAQKREVRCFKDRMKLRLKRARKANES